jgi:Zn-dependent M28 family amino/carboxypeptidase
VANVNLDMPVLTYEFSNVVAFGIERSTLKSPVLNALRKVNVSLIDDPWADQGFFTRSDHYNFVRQGIPAIYVIPGTGSFLPEEDGAKAKEVFDQTHYHKPSDDMGLAINWQAAQRFAEVNFLIGIEIADQAERIQWQPGDFFGELFRRR